MRPDRKQDAKRFIAKTVGDEHLTDRDADTPLSVRQWPDPPARAAFYGLAGEYVDIIEEHTEADPVAVLVQLLVGFGNAIGRNTYFEVGADRHHLNLFALVIGHTASGRKGLSWSEARRPLSLAAEAWAKTRIVGGLSSGEGLIHAVRDPSDDDKGEPDKRLLVIETEFAGTLKVMARDGSTLSTTIRQAWDSGDLRTMPKKPVKATGAHISILGHVTPQELRKRLDSVDIANGFLNRFLLVCARRSKYLPEGGALDPRHVTHMAAFFAKCMTFSEAVGHMERDGAARELWHAEYKALADGRPGLMGAATSRAEAQVMRLACLYALLGESRKVAAPHLTAALALWRYVEASAEFVFGGALGNPVADEILRALRDRTLGGLTRTEISEHFKRHRKASEIDDALRLLAEQGLVSQVMEPTAGRSREVWYAALRGAKKAKDARDAENAGAGAGDASLISLISRPVGEAT